MAVKPSWIRTVLLGGFALPRIWGRTLVVTALATLITVLYETVPFLHYSITATPFTIIALPLGIFLGFRNNAAYDRFWEGRRLWGQLVNYSRTATRQYLTLIDDGDEAAKELRVQLVHFVIAYAHALRYHLRDTSPHARIARVLPESEVKLLEGADNVPIAMLQRMGELVVVARKKGWVNELHVPLLDASLTAFTDIQGACERIKSTPIPYSYTVLLHRIVAVYCLGLPFGLEASAHWATPLVVLAVSYCFFGLDAVGDELEQPFGLDVNDLPLKTLSRNIERNLRERLGEELPPKTQSEKGIFV